MPKPDTKVIAGVVEISDEHERRIAALEAHLADLEERLNDRGVFSGDKEISA